MASFQERENPDVQRLYSDNTAKHFSLNLIHSTMDIYYNEAEARDQLEHIAEQRIFQGPKPTQLACYTEDGGAGALASPIHVKKPPLCQWKLASPVDGENGLSEEVVLRAQGVLCQKDLPPIQRPINANSPRVLKYIKQSITITGLGASYFQSFLDAIHKIHHNFSCKLPEKTLVSWQPVLYNDHLAISMSNPHYTPRNLMAMDSMIPFKACVDPEGILQRAMGTEFGHTPENEVEYFELHIGEDGSKHYKQSDPAIFRNGDIVEAQISFIVIPMHGQKSFRLLLVLRAITLLDSKIRVKAELARNQAESTVSIIPRIILKRRVGYEDDETDETRSKISRLTINESDTQ